MRKKTEDEQENGGILKWGICRHDRKDISDSSNLDYIMMHLWNDNISLPVTITPVSVMQKWWGRFPAFSFSSQSSDESCTSTPLVIWGSAQTNICTSFSIHSSIQPTSWNQGKGFSPILPSKNGKKKTRWKHHYKKAKGKTYWTSSCCVLNSSVAAVILLSKGKRRQMLPQILYDPIYLSKSALCVLVKVQNHVNHLQRKEQGEQRLPLLTPVSSCNTSLNLGDDDLIFWQSLTWAMRYKL